MATVHSTVSCVMKGLACTVPKVIAMISADKIKSVRIAPLILPFSSATRSTAGFASAVTSFSCEAARPAAVCMNLWATFSKPSKHKKAPPTINSGVTAQGAKALMASAAGTRIALLINEPLATAQTTGSSRSALTPETCCALSARSSPRTPAVFLAATLDSKATSSRTLAMSSINASKLLAMFFQFREKMREMVMFLMRIVPFIKKPPCGGLKIDIEFSGHATQVCCDLS